MKLSSTLYAGLALTATASAYSIDLWSKYDYQGDQAKFVTSPSPWLSLLTTDGIHKVTWSGGAGSWIWKSGFNDGCCVVFCRGSTNVGKYCQSAAKTESSAGVNKVVTGCGSTTLNC
ncbi:hypothetical protein CLAIMM_11878 isoform 2 [Cladophialophora immunda]|nr:hypothetical protein CLAIMM_11878 isoform 2 [Cladophialophora immunda]